MDTGGRLDEEGWGISDNNPYIGKHSSAAAWIKNLGELFTRYASGIINSEQYNIRKEWMEEAYDTWRLQLPPGEEGTDETLYESPEEKAYHEWRNSQGITYDDSVTRELYERWKLAQTAVIYEPDSGYAFVGLGAGFGEDYDFTNIWQGLNGGWGYDSNTMAIIPYGTVAGYLTQYWPQIVGILRAAGLTYLLDTAIEIATGGPGFTNIDDIVPWLIAQGNQKSTEWFGGDKYPLATAAQVASGLENAPGWGVKKCTKYVRRQAKTYDAMYKPMKTFTNAEKNGYSMGHRVASVWWSKALRRAKRRSYRAGQRKMQQKMMMMGQGRGNMVMVDT